MVNFTQKNFYQYILLQSLTRPCQALFSGAEAICGRNDPRRNAETGRESSPKSNLVSILSTLFFPFQEP